MTSPVISSAVGAGGRRRAEERRSEERAPASLDALAQRGVVGAGVILEPQGHVRRSLCQPCDLAAGRRARPGHDRAARVRLDRAHDDERRAALDAQGAGVDAQQAPRLERLAHRYGGRRGRGSRSRIPWQLAASLPASVQVSRAANVDRFGT